MARALRRANLKLPATSCIPCTLAVPDRRPGERPDAADVDVGAAEHGPKPPTQATCTHAKYWKRLRAKRGAAYFLCFQCGAKWRTCSQAMRAQQEAAQAAEYSDRSDPETPVAAPSPASTP